MIVKAINTRLVRANEIDLLDLIDESIDSIDECSVLAITSKVVSLCEGNVIPFDETDKEKLVVSESDLYLPSTLSKYGHHFTITNNTLIPTSGVDESNGDDNYILWPKDSQATANLVRLHLKNKFGLQNVGVLITDSTCHPLRRGTTGISLAHSGFMALKNYVGKPDLFDKKFKVSQADISGGLTASAVVCMGEGTEQTPLVLISDIPFVTFQDRDPSAQELKDINIPLEEDLFEPFLTSVKWEKGERSQKS